MGRIDALDDEFKGLVHRYLRTGLPLTEIQRIVNDALADAGEKPLSYSSLNRYAARVEQSAHRMRQAREMARVWKTRFGEEPDEDLTALMVDMLQTEVFEAITRLQQSDEALDAETVNQLALGMQRLARAAEISAKREREIRREAAAAAKREMNEKLRAAEKDVESGADPMQRYRRIRRELYGLTDE